MVRPRAGVGDVLAAITGFGLLIGGVAAWSWPGAMVLAGALILAASLWRTAE